MRKMTNPTAFCGTIPHFKQLSGVRPKYHLTNLMHVLSSKHSVDKTASLKKTERKNTSVLKCFQLFSFGLGNVMTSK